MSKLHIPGPGTQATACGRQLNNHRSDRTQNASNAELAKTEGDYLTALQDGKACRHCGRAAGLVAKVVRVQRDQDNESDDE